MILEAHLEQHSFQELRERLVGKKRGVAKAFKLALAEAAHMWRKKYLKEHFEETAYSRYGSRFLPARYASMRPVMGQTGTINRRWERIFAERTGLTMASSKMRNQFWRRMRMDNRPGVWSGGSRRGMLQGRFRVKGSSTQVRGSWNDSRINWYGMSNPEYRGNWTMTTDSEAEAMRRYIEDKALPYYLAIVDKGGTLPDLTETPRVAS